MILRPGLAPGRAARTVRANLTEQAAAEFVRGHGGGALAILGERAELAEELGHRVAAKTWREMGGAAARLLGVEQLDIERPQPAAPFTAPLPFPQ